MQNDSEILPDFTLSRCAGVVSVGSYSISAQGEQKIGEILRTLMLDVYYAREELSQIRVEQPNI